MLLSIALMVILGFTLSGLFTRLKLPGLLGMMITGIFLGPFVLNLISPDILNISKDLREIALIVILIRAGLSLDIRDLKRSDVRLFSCVLFLPLLRLSLLFS